MAQSKSEPRTMREDEEDNYYQPSDKEHEVVRKVIGSFRETYDERNKNLQYFDGRNLIEYIEDSARRFYTNVNKRDGIDDWQATIHDPFTHNKVLAFLSKVVKVLPKGTVLSRGTDDKRKGEILSKLYDYSEDADDYEEFMIFALFEAIEKGTVICYEGYSKNKRSVRDITGYDEDGEMQIEENEIEENKLFSSIVPIEEFYPESTSIRNVKDMNYCFWSETMPFTKFQSDYGEYSNAEYVEPFSGDVEGEEVPDHKRNLEATVHEGEVRVIKYYNKQTDEYIIIANTIWLNPLNNEVVSPLPWNHKELPFFNIKFDFFGSDFFYGKSLPDKLKNLQDVLDALTNMMLDQSFLTIFAPILTTGQTNVEEDYLKPGRRINVDTQGMKLNESFMKLDLGAPSGWHQYILEYMRSIMEESSVDQVSQGVAGVGGRTTAKEIQKASEAVEALLGLFGKMINYGVKRKVRFRVKNIQQFWTDENTPIMQKIVGGEVQDTKDAFNIIELDNSRLSDGRTGTTMINMISDKDDMPSKEKQKSKREILEKESGKNIELITLTPDYIRDTKFDVKIGIDQSRESSKEINKALALEETRVLMSMFPEIVNSENLATNLVEAYDGDPEKMLNLGGQQDLRSMLAQQGGGSDVNQQMSQNPQGDVSNNMVRGMTGGESNSNELRQLQNSLTG
jgi:hypothetical protein